jgi:hypothetical protein
MPHGATIMGVEPLLTSIGDGSLLGPMKIKLAYHPPADVSHHERLLLPSSVDLLCGRIRRGVQRDLCREEYTVVVHAVDSLVQVRAEASNGCTTHLVAIVTFSVVVPPITHGKPVQNLFRVLRYGKRSDTPPASPIVSPILPPHHRSPAVYSNLFPSPKPGSKGFSPGSEAGLMLPPTFLSPVISSNWPLPSSVRPPPSPKKNTPTKRRSYGSMLGFQETTPRYTAQLDRLEARAVPVARSFWSALPVRRGAPIWYSGVFDLAQRVLPSRSARGCGWIVTGDRQQQAVALIPPTGTTLLIVDSGETASWTEAILAESKGLCIGEGYKKDILVLTAEEAVRTPFRWTPREWSRCIIGSVNVLRTVWDLLCRYEARLHDTYRWLLTPQCPKVPSDGLDIQMWWLGVLDTQLLAYVRQNQFCIWSESAAENALRAHTFQAPA